MHLPEWLEQWDQNLFLQIHYHFASPLVDPLMKALREPGLWAPLYVFIIYYAFKHFKRYAWMFILLSVVCFALADFSSASIFKPFFMRPRPCHNPDLQTYIRGIVGCGGHYSFPSSHASNHFALATFWFGSLWMIKLKRWYWLWIWAISIVYAQIYVGKHYPLDVAAGALLGTLIGIAALTFFRYWLQLPKQQNFTHG
jgi:undecaprenyl-diphosphatase